MGTWSRVGTLLEVAALVFVVAMVAGQVLGQPVLLGFVTTGSMQPTMEPGDGFVAIPADVAGPIEEGDVVTFRAEQLHDGGLTTHRVVEVTDRGYVTRGDNNPFTDQDGDEPLVKRPQVVAKAWQPGGEVLVIPGVGTAVTGVQSTVETVQRELAVLTGARALLGTQGILYLVLGLSLLLYVVDLFVSGGSGRRRTRDRSRETGTSTRLLLGVFAAAMVLAATAAMVVPAGSQEFGVVSAESDAPGPRVIERGTSESASFQLGNGGFVPVLVISEPASEGVAVSPRETVVPARGTVNATLTLSAPPETGYYRRYVVEHRYLLVLPESVVRGLYGVHPWAPIIAIDAVLGGGFYLLGAALLGRGRLRSRSRSGPSRLQRLRNRLSS